jgi:hypothetical protein
MARGITSAVVTSQPPPLSLLRLSFANYEDFRVYARSNVSLLDHLWLWRESVGDRGEKFVLLGVCEFCECQTGFAATPQKMPPADRFGFRVDWWSSVMCGCGMSNLDRIVIRVLLDGGNLADHVYHVGHHSRFCRWIMEHMPNVTTSQYQAGRHPGEIANGIRYEDLTCLSFADSTFDCIICMEVLEHLPDYRLALSEMRRTLRPGGRMLLTFPWLGGDRYEHEVRAEILADGSIRHLLPPEYHDDPSTQGDILSYRSFGWRILDEIREAGFQQAAAQFVFGPLHGYMTLATPVIVAVR